MIVDELEFSRVESAVRHGLEPNCPEVLAHYLDMSRTLVQEDYGVTEPFNMHLRVARTLLDALCDTLVVNHWRHLCLNNIYQPIFAAERTAHSTKQKRQMHRFRRELNILGNYFLG